MDTIQVRVKEWRNELVSLAMVDGVPINPRRALLEIQKALPENAIVATDIGNVASTSNSYLEFKGEGKHIAALTYGNTGFSYPAALGHKWLVPRHL